MLRAPLGNAHHYLSELVDSLKKSPGKGLPFPPFGGCPWRLLEPCGTLSMPGKGC
jgi:hypothetical protein